MGSKLNAMESKASLMEESVIQKASAHLDKKYSNTLTDLDGRLKHLEKVVLKIETD
jgi:hypothetical protein